MDRISYFLGNVPVSSRESMAIDNYIDDLVSNFEVSCRIANEAYGTPIAEVAMEGVLSNAFTAIKTW